MPADAVLRSGLEVLFVVALGGTLWAAVRRARAGEVTVPRCPACGRAASRAYPACGHCGAARGDNASDHS